MIFTSIIVFFLFPLMKKKSTLGDSRTQKNNNNGELNKKSSLLIFFCKIIEFLPCAPAGSIAKNSYSNTPAGSCAKNIHWMFSLRLTLFTLCPTQTAFSLLLQPRGSLGCSVSQR
jgi:hypothetical protein